MKSAYDRIIGIDPDCDKSGVAEVYIPSKHVNATKLLFPELMDYLQHMKREFSGNGEKILVVVEAGWMNASNWHTGRVRSIAAAAKTGQNTGRNHEVARKIAEAGYDGGQAAAQKLERHGRQDNARGAVQAYGSKRDSPYADAD